MLRGEGGGWGRPFVAAALSNACRPLTVGSAASGSAMVAASLSSTYTKANPVTNPCAMGAYLIVDGG